MHPPNKNCTLCFGEGKYNCTHCGGNGKFSYIEIIDNENILKISDCPRCKGTGAVKCFCVTIGPNE